MKSVSSKKNSNTLTIVLFFIITLGWADGIWSILIPSVQQHMGIKLNQHWVWLGLIGPGLAAIILSFATNSWRGLTELIKPLSYYRVNYSYYVFVYLGVFFFFCAGSWFTALFQDVGQIEKLVTLWNNSSSYLLKAKGIWILIETTIIYTMCEELGWRGFALPRLATMMNVFWATILLGFVWTLFHIPLLCIYGAHFTVMSTMIYSLSIICSSIVYSWLYFKTGCSLLLVGLLHGSLDTLGMFFPAIVAPIGQGPNFYMLLMEILLAILMSPYLLQVNKNKIHAHYTSKCRKFEIATTNSA